MTRHPEVADLVPAFLETLEVRRYAKGTVLLYERALRRFVSSPQLRSVARPGDVTSEHLESYQREVLSAGRMGASAQGNHLTAIRTFFQWLRCEGRIVWDPSEELVIPRRGHRLPRYVLTADRVERLLALPDVARPVGLRDRAMLEVLYSTALRRSELLKLELYDVRAEQGVVMVREGKGSKDRVVPIGERALHWLTRYLEQARPVLVREDAEPRLFAVRPKRLERLVRRYLDRAGVGRPGGCHVLRHTAATLMLENGADIRHIQEMLGHEHLCTTQLYTRVSVRALRDVQRATHPAWADAGIGSVPR